MASTAGWDRDSLKGYVGRAGAQVHYRVWESASGPATQPDLYCFHPAPFSGLAYATLAPLLAQDRRVIAPDYPGYGGSAPRGDDASIAMFAEAMSEVVAALSSGQSVDVLGFHTGCLVAAELAISGGAPVRRAALVDAPAFPAEASANMAAKFGADFAITPDRACLDDPWNGTFTTRIEPQGKDRAFAIMVEQLRPGKAMNRAFAAAFSYPWEERLPQLRAETIMLASQSGLLDGTRAIAKIVPGAKLVERLDVKRSVLDESAEITASEVLAFLDGDA